jgi:hypothetical protein
MHTSQPARLAEALRKVADLLDAIETSSLAPAKIAASLDLQMSEVSGPQPARIDAVNTVATALGLSASQISESFWRTPYGGTVDGLDISVYTATASKREQELELENARLRAQLAEGGAQ